MPTPAGASNTYKQQINTIAGQYNVLDYGADDTGAADSSTAIQAAIDAANTAGGGVVVIPNGTFKVLTPLVPKNGVTVRGSGYNIIASEVIDGGTIMQGDGTDSCFAYNATDAGGQPILATIEADTLYGFHLSGMGFDNFVTPVKIGARYNTGIQYCSFSDMFATNCTGWGFYFENCSLSVFSSLRVRKLATGATGGIYYGSSQTAYNHGNNEIRSWFVETNQPCRGIVIQARDTSSLNHNDIFHIQCNQGSGSKTTEVVNLTNTSNDITVADATAYPVDMPITFATTASGFVKYKTYFVTYSSGTTIRVAEFMGGTVLTAATATTTITLEAYGYAPIEICGYGAKNISNIQPSQILGVDAEGIGTCMVLMQNARVMIEIGPANYDQGTNCANTLTGRNVVGQYRSTGTFCPVDIDSAYDGFICLGLRINSSTYPESFVDEPPQGIYRDGATSEPMFNIARNLMGGNYSFKGQNAASGSIIYPNVPFGQRCNYSNSTSLNLWATHAGCIVYTGTGTATWTLPAITDTAGGTAGSEAGIVYEVCNGSTSAVTLTLAANTGDNFNRQTAKTSYALTQGQSITVRCNFDGSTAFWQVTGNNGAT